MSQTCTISPPRYLRCEDGKFRKGVIVTFSGSTGEDKYAIYDGEYLHPGTQAQLVTRATSRCREILGGNTRVREVITVEFGALSNVPACTSYTIQSLKITRTIALEISPKNSIKFNINLCRHSHEHIS